MASTLSEHIVSSYEDELTYLARLISEMGGMVEHAITDATSALLKLDHDLARQVRAADKRIDEMQRRIDDLAVSMIARRQPMAADLRMIITAMHRSRSPTISSAPATWPSNSANARSRSKA